MHFGTGPGHADAFVDLDPYILDEHLSEIEVCSRVSKSVFFLVSSTCNSSLRARICGGNNGNFFTLDEGKAMLASKRQLRMSD